MPIQGRRCDSGWPLHFQNTRRAPACAAESPKLRGSGAAPERRAIFHGALVVKDNTAGLHPAEAGALPAGSTISDLDSSGGGLPFAMIDSERSLNRLDRLALIGTIFVPTLILGIALQLTPQFDEEYDRIMPPKSVVPRLTALILNNYQLFTSLAATTGLLSIVAAAKFDRSPAIRLTALMVILTCIAAFVTITGLCVPLLPLYPRF